MRLTLALVALLGLSLAGASNAAVKPKPWQWSPAKVVTRLKAATPLAPTEVGNAILEARCRGLGKGVAGRYSRFSCQTRWGGSNGSYDSVLTLRVLALGSGKLCVVTSSDGRSLPSPGPLVQAARACPR